MIHRTVMDTKLLHTLQQVSDFKSHAASFENQMHETIVGFACDSTGEQGKKLK